MKEHRIQSDYLRSVYEVDTYTVRIKKFAKVLEKFRKKNYFDAIAFTGTSGAAYAYPLSAMLGIPLICIRKDKNSHFPYTIEGCVTADRYVIVDDFISGGSTMKKITDEIKYWMPLAKPVAIFLYAMDGYNNMWNSTTEGGPKELPIHYPLKPIKRKVA